MLNFLFNNHCDVPQKLQAKELKSKQLTFIPFSSTRKRSLVANTLDEETVRIIVKGAPEFILNCCTAVMDGNCESGDFGEENATAQYEKITEVISSAADDMYLKPITYAYKDMAVSDFEALKSENNDFEKEEHRQCLESELTYVATFYLQDGLRDSVHDASDELFMAGINSRIISGDYEATVLKVSKAIGLKEEGNESEAMSGSRFREIVTPLVKKVDQGERYSWTFVSDEARRTFKDQIKEQINVIYRANPEDKHMFVACMQEFNTKCAFMGESLNDTLALSEAKIGFAMGQDGCAAAKAHSDIIILNDNYCSIRDAVRWGRNIIDNIRRFAQFQLTVNFSCILIVFLGSVSFGSSPFNIIQLLWINLIMDVLAAIALATEAPAPVIRAERVKNKDPVLDSFMWRQINS